MSGRGKNIPVETFALLDQGEQDIQLGKTREVVLVFGAANADKTSLVRFLAGDGDNLISRAVWDSKKNGFDYHIEEGLTRKVESSAFVPRLIVDEDADVTFYDFPEFRNGVSAEEEIATAYFAEKVISRAESVKILFVLNHKSVKNGNYNLLRDFISRATGLIKNLNNLESSMGLVVTQVDATGSEDLIRVSVNNYNELTCKTMQGCTDHEINFLNLLLATPRGVSKIGTWSKPTDEGFLRELPIYKTEKMLLKKLTHESLIYGNYGKNDFAYELSYLPKMYVPSLAEEIVTQIGERLIGLYRDQEIKLNHIEELQALFKEANNAIFKPRNTDPRGVLARTLQTLNQKNDVSDDKLTDVLNAEKYLTFLERAYGQFTVSLGKKLTNFQSYLENSEIWYGSLVGMLNVQLSSYNVQKPKSVQLEALKKEARYLENIMSNARGSLKAYYRDFQTARFVQLGRNFKDFIKTPDSEIYGYPVEFEVDGKKKELLARVVDIILRENNDLPKCQDNRLTITGRFIKTSEIMEHMKTCKSNPKDVEVFAMQKIFIDSDIDFTGKEVQLSFIAPNWEVIGNPKIILNGEPGGAMGKITESSNVLEGSDGKPGEPGKAGGPAGQFLGIAENCMECKNMSVFLIGGKGGPGQDGGKGVNGKDGRRAYDPTTDGSYTSMEDRWSATGYLTNYEGKMSSPYCWVTSRPWPDEIYQCLVMGEAGQKGGKGGDGGKGGLGGVQGQYVFVDLKEYQSPTFEKKDGPSGAVGTRGSPGMGGKYGDNYRMKGRRNWIDDKLFNMFEKTGVYYSNSTRPLKGDEGKDGYYGDESKMKKDRKTLGDVDQSSPVSNYKAFLRKKLNTTQVPKHSQRLLGSLESDRRITGIYNVMGLVKDLQNLEDQYNELLQNRVPIAPYYTSLRDRVFDYAQHLSKTNENNNDHKLVLSYLYSLILIKIRNINNKFNDGLVVDIYQHIVQASSEIEILKKKSEAVMRNKSKQNYMGNINSKITEADSLINDIIEPALKKAIAETDEQIVSLIKETLEFKATAQKQQDQLILKQHKLQDQMVLRYILGTVQVASSLLALAGPVGATVGAAIGGATQVAKGLLLTDDDGNHNLQDIPEGAKKTYSAIADHFKKKKEDFEKQLDDAKTTLDKLDAKTKNDKSIKDIRAGITDTKEQLKGLMSKDDDFVDPEALDKMYNMRNKLTKLMDEEKVKLTESKTKTESVLKKIDFVGKAKIVFEAGKVGKGVYDEIMKSQKSIDNLGDSIKKASDDISKLEKQEKKIHETMKQTCEGLRKSVDNIRETSSTKSHAALDVSKWQIQGNLWDISQKLKAMTDGYKAQGRLLFLINEVERGMNTMIQIYDRIQEYQEAAQLADYLSHTSMNGATLESVSDDKLRSTVNYLDQNMHFNMVLKEYEKSINALKHSVFPLAGNYTRLPRETFTFEFDDETPKIVSVVESMKGEFNSILSELLKDKTHSRQIHQVTHNNQLYMKNHKPFYTWKFPANDVNIAKLLDGRGIVLAADVSADEVEAFKHDAIKFSLIGIRLQLPGKAQDAQGKLDNLLSGFVANMTHQGDSHYMCCDSSYIVNHDVQVIETFVNKDDPNEQIGNEQFDQLKEKKALLSPYTTWKINLLEDTTAKGKRPSFEELQKFLRNKAVEIELEGKGSYIRRGFKTDELICNSMKMTDFYQEDATHSKEGRIKPQIQNDIYNLMEKEENSKTRNRRSVEDTESEKSFFSDSLSLLSQSAVKYMNPANWFIRDVTEESSNDANIGVNASPTNTALPGSPVKLVAYDETSSVDSQFNTDLNLQSNLMLMGLMVPNAKVRSKRSTKLDILNHNLAHDMAYRAQIPSNGSK